MLRPAGPDLARRWLAALLLVPPEERGAVVAEVERRVAGLYGGDAPEVHVVHPVRQKDGFVERVETTYVVRRPEPAPKERRSRRGA